MTSQSPRIYTYKITFEEVPYYYYGVKKEDYYNQEYWGSPYTHKWCWDFYTPKKQILQFFNFTDEGWLEAQEVEKRLIRPFYNTDKWCLNENVSGKISLEVCRKVGLRHKENSTGIFSLTPEEKSELGRKNGLKSYENGTGLFSLTPEKRRETTIKAGIKTKENGTGIFAQTPEQRSENGRKAGIKTKENGTGIFSLTPEQQSVRSRKGGKRAQELGRGIHGRTKEQMTEDGKMGAQKVKELGVGIYAITPKERSEISRKVASQKWMCLETGYVSNAGALSHYQRARGIDTSKRKRIS